MTYTGGAPYAGPTGFGGDGGPDWQALAEAHEQEQRRSRRVRIGAAAGAVLASVGVVAAAVALLGGKPAPSADHAPTAPAVAPPATGSAPSPAGSPGASRTAPGPAGPLQLPDTGGAHPLTVETAASVGQSDGHSGPTLVLGGSPTAFAQTASQVVDTTRSFTVSAAVRNDAPAGARAAVSQGTGSYYAFDLGRDYWGSHNQWVFKVQTAAGDADNTVKEAFSAETATVGRWTLLTGVYDAQAKTITLYVDGALAQTTQLKGIWPTTGPLQIGRTRYHSAWVDSWTGAIGDVQLWDRALTAGQIAQLKATGGASAGVPAAASWLLP